MKTNVLYVDPAWNFKTWSRKGEGRAPQAEYRTTSVEDMKRLPVADLAHKDCALFMWTVDWLPPSVAPELAAAWGFRYATRAWVWIKSNRASKKGFFTGKGYYTRGNPEDCLLFINKGGRMPVLPANRPLSVIYSPVREPGRKPDEGWDLIERMYPDHIQENPPVELFARYARPGWHQLGDAMDGLDLSVSIPMLAADDTEALSPMPKRDKTEQLEMIWNEA